MIARRGYAVGTDGSWTNPLQDRVCLFHYRGSTNFLCIRMHCPIRYNILVSNAAQCPPMSLMNTHGDRCFHPGPGRQYMWNDIGDHIQLAHANHMFDNGLRSMPGHCRFLWMTESLLCTTSHRGPPTQPLMMPKLLKCWKLFARFRYCLSWRGNCIFMFSHFRKAFKPLCKAE